MIRDRNTKSAWLAALIFPFFMVPFIAGVFEAIKPVGRFVDNLPLVLSILFVNLLFLAPSIACLSFFKQPKKHIALFVLVYIPLLWLYGAMVSCKFFNSCL